MLDYHQVTTNNDNDTTKTDIYTYAPANGGQLKILLSDY